MPNVANGVKKYALQSGVMNLKLIKKKLENLGNIYLTGGTSDTEAEGIHTTTVSCYSVKSNNWSTVCPMNQARSSHVTISHGKICFFIFLFFLFFYFCILTE